jgi:hypothetical protein
MIHELEQISMEKDHQTEFPFEFSELSESQQRQRKADVDKSLAKLKDAVEHS